jgi:hypothetical protein
MSSFSHAPTSLARSLVVVALLLAPGSAWGHALLARYHVLPGRKVQVDCRFDDDTACPDARIKVLRADGTLLLEGKANSRGVFVFPFREPEDLVLDVRHPGHRVNPAPRIRAEELMPSYTEYVRCAFIACLPPPMSPLTAAILFGGYADAVTEETTAEEVAPLDDGGREAPVGKLLLGVGLLLGLAGVFLLLQHVRAWRASRAKSSAAPSPPAGRR